MPSAADAVRLLRGRRLVVLTGAGLSTDSGIPDYRGPNAPQRMPMTYGEFVSGPTARQRYWARSHVGWSRMRQAEPNAGHLALARLDPELLITQNVDGLHERAGSRRMVALHGRIAEVVCLQCGEITARAELQTRLDALNPGWAEAHADVEIRPDGDVELDDTAGFVVPACTVCGGILKPHVVFFGENVPKQRVAVCTAAVDALASAHSVSNGGATRGHEAAVAHEMREGALLVVGSSLTVMSGLRFVRRAAKAGVPVVIANRGATRGDDLATLRLEVGAAPFLTGLVAALPVGSPVA